ncbi:hypothetical protein AB0A63_26520 [Lentzea sp. NPDC042327]|uniref:hypothetical protein n=1 Tax=Lentzea sp. NPDC042327 TaxID=3154801 RepID=UPI0033ECEC2A
MGALRIGVRVVLGVVALVVVAVLWTVFSWGLASTLADREVDRITAALRTAAADGELTPDEIRSAGGSSSMRSGDGTVYVTADSGEPPWWSPIDWHLVRYADCTVRGSAVEVSRSTLGGTYGGIS